MVKLNADTIILVTAADAARGCSVQHLREAYDGLEKRRRTIAQIRSLVLTYQKYGRQIVE